MKTRLIKFLPSSIGQFRPCRELTFLPYRTHDAKYGAPKKLGDGFPAINFATRQMWIGDEGKVIEVKTLADLIDCYERIVKRHI